MTEPLKVKEEASGADGKSVDTLPPEGVPGNDADRFDAKAFLSTLTDLPGVYRMLAADGTVLYVGKAKNLKKRVSSYFREHLASPRIAHMVSQIAAIETTSTRTEAEALLLESNLIKSLAPRYNILFRDDKTYPYIVLTQGDFPRLGFFRGQPDKKGQFFGPYPSAWAVRDSIHWLQKMFRLRTCEDTVFANRSRACLLYQIKRCSGPCVDRITPADYAADVQLAALFLNGKAQEITDRLKTAMEQAAAQLDFEAAALYRDQIQSLRQVQEKQYVSSNKDEDVDILVAEMASGGVCVNLAMVRGGRHLGDRAHFSSQAGEVSPPEALAAFLRQHYAAHPIPGRVLVSPWPAEDEEGEIAALLGSLAGRRVPLGEARGLTQQAWVEMARQNARLAILARAQASAQQGARCQALQEALGLTEALGRIECFDISHTQGEATVASCVVYDQQGMKRADYRRFNIRDVTPGDDYAAIAQAVRRRYESVAAAEGRLPDLLLIDGGKGQVAAAQRVLADLGLSSLPMVGVAKGEGRKAGLESLIFPDGRAPLQLPPSHPGLHLVQEIRDEAHRFAITGHRARRNKARKTSTLEEIPGVGPVKRKALLTHFGGLAGVREAAVEQLQAVPGISRELAETLYAALH